MACLKENQGTKPDDRRMSVANGAAAVQRGKFTLPGEAGYEQLTLALAQRWGADAVRDSDGTRLSDEILSAGFDVYSTVCIIRDHNAWISAHPDARQQCFLCTAPAVSTGTTLAIDLMSGFFDGQFAINDHSDSLACWQVYDRTVNRALPDTQWRYIARTGRAEIQTVPWHRYTVSFLAYRIWEEISMYNHVTNSWDKEHLMQLDPFHPEARIYLRKWLIEWCDAHPHTSVVRFTSLYYNFAWIWGSDPRNRNLFSDWASYDFAVSPSALRAFEKQYGYALCAEDFVRGGRYNATHCVPSSHKKDWMAFVGSFVRSVGMEHVDIVHQAGKKAYVFCDDSWIGLEPYSGLFETFGFDGIIKCVFSGYEARFCAGVPVATHELRFHPYLFPVGLGGAPTFSPSGTPGRDALGYWINVRRALLRQTVERVGLGGYLHLTQGYPDFLEAMDRILEQFRTLSALHEGDSPLTVKPRIGVLHAWGALRTWTLSGHFHETKDHVLIHLLESLAGLPFEVSFVSFEDLRSGVPDTVDVLINAGEAGSAWSGGILWDNDQLIETLTAWVHRGGIFLGVGEPSALDGRDTYLRMAHVLGVDLDTGDRCCHGRWPFIEERIDSLDAKDVAFPVKPELYLTDGKARVILADGSHALATAYRFGEGMGLYCTGFHTDPVSTRWLQRLLNYAMSGSPQGEMITDSPDTECAVFPKIGKLALVNNADRALHTSVSYQGVRYEAEMEPFGLAVLEIARETPQG